MAWASSRTRLHSWVDWQASSGRLQKAFRLRSRGSGSSLQLEDLSRQLRVHANYLGQVIEQQCGKSFRELLQDLRIEKSKILLAVGEYTVTETAYFSSRSAAA
jgi:YesN/AraC family two-component response regulator